MIANYAIIERRCLNMENSTQNANNKPSKISRFLNIPIVANAIGALIAAAILGIGAVVYAKVNSFTEIPSRLDNLERRIGVIEVALGIGGSSGQGSGIPMQNPTQAENKSGFILISDVSDSMQNYIGDMINAIGLRVSSTQYAAPPRTQAIDPIGYVGEMEEERNVEQMADQKLLLNYMDGERQVFFYGQFDTDGYWTGNCIINTYEDGYLTLIIDADYEHGALLTFEQAFPNEAERQDGRNVWYFSKRTMKEDFSVGETWDYFWDDNIEQEFSTDSVTADNILTVKDLRDKIGEDALEGYYNGNISNGLFNDDSGTAYMVKYFDAEDDGKTGDVRTLYVGKFKDGFPEDSANGSWLIGKNNATESLYSYYKGPFTGGHPSISVESKNAGNYWKIRLEDQDWIVALAEEFKSDSAIPVPLTGLIPNDEINHSTK